MDGTHQIFEVVLGTPEQLAEGRDTIRGEKGLVLDDTMVREEGQHLRVFRIHRYLSDEAKSRAGGGVRVWPCVRSCAAAPGCFIATLQQGGWRTRKS